MAYYKGNNNDDGCFFWLIVVILVGACWPLAIIFIIAYVIYDSLKK